MIWKRIAPIVYRLAVLGVLAGGITPWYIVARLPFWPVRPDAAHVAPFSNHGSIHYMEKWEGLWVDNVTWVFFPSMMLFVGTVVLGRVDERGRPQG